MVSVFANANAILGEGPVWSVGKQTLYWVDIKGKDVYSKGIADASFHKTTFDKRPSALGESKNGLVIAFEDGLFHVLDGQREPFCQLDEGPENRTNDGKVAPDGSFWVGTMDDYERNKTGALYRISSDCVITKLLEGIGISNTLAWDLERNLFYFADSMEQVIWSFRYDKKQHSLTDKQQFVSLRGTRIYPDGSAIDAHGFLWNAQWDGSRVVRYSPSGDIDRIIDLPVSRPTSCCFGGPDMKTLFITSASIGIHPDEQPLAGSVFSIKVDVPGVTPRLFGASG